MTNKCLIIRAPHNEDIELVYLILQRETYMKSYWTSFVPPNIVEFKVISKTDTKVKRFMNRCKDL